MNTNVEICHFAGTKTLARIIRDLDHYIAALGHPVDRFIVTKKAYREIVDASEKYLKKAKHSPLGRTEGGEITHRGIVIEKD